MTLLFHAVLISFFYLTTDKSTLLEKKSFFSRRQETFSELAVQYMNQKRNLFKYYERKLI